MAEEVITKGYKKTEVGLIPKDWESEKLGVLGEPLIGLTYRPKDVCEAGTLVLRSSNIQKGVLCFNDNVFVNSEIPQRIMVQPDDILICVRNGSRDLIGKSALIDSRANGMTFGAFMAVFRSQYGRFIHFIFQSEILRKQINEHLGATINQITNKSLGSFFVPMPQMDCERRAIATALSDIDALIAGLDQLIAKKRALKKAAMQQLLTGKKRLPGFQGEWQVEYIENLAAITTGGKNTQDRIDDGHYPFFVRSQTIERINSYSFDGEAVLTAGDGVGTGKVFHYINGKFDAHQRVYRISDFTERLDGYFFFLFFSNNFYSRIMQMTAKSSVDSVRREMIARMPIFLPPSREEQTAIATILSDMDAELAALEQRRDKTRLLKQGMMQELLTGRIRLVPPATSAPTNGSVPTHPASAHPPKVRQVAGSHSG